MAKYVDAQTPDTIGANVCLNEWIPYITFNLRLGVSGCLPTLGTVRSPGSATETKVSLTGQPGESIGQGVVAHDVLRYAGSQGRTFVELMDDPHSFNNLSPSTTIGVAATNHWCRR